GGYAVQGLGARLVERVDGCFTNVIGLPIETTRRMLQRAGVI
ncbi:MAG TPA: Maf family protein, partial [Candidatus Binatia bacterium]|nr:Maf family protein [Candidatus Binatia bacterium]